MSATMACPRDAAMNRISLLVCGWTGIVQSYIAKRLSTGAAGSVYTMKKGIGWHVDRAMSMRCWVPQISRSEFVSHSYCRVRAMGYPLPMIKADVRPPSFTLSLGGRLIVRYWAANRAVQGGRHLTRLPILCSAVFGRERRSENLRGSQVVGAMFSLSHGPAPKPYWTFLVPIGQRPACRHKLSGISPQSKGCS